MSNKRESEEGGGGEQQNGEENPSLTTGANPSTDGPQ
jgi:hypothetical protein